jgi:hypothetical protein
MEKTTKEIRATIDAEIKRKFDAAYKFKGIGYNEALEQAMELFTKINIEKPDLNKLNEVL